MTRRHRGPCKLTPKSTNGYASGGAHLLPTLRRLDKGNSALEGTRLYDTEPIVVDTPTEEDLEAEQQLHLERKQRWISRMQDKEELQRLQAEEDEALAAVQQMHAQQEASRYRDWEQWEVQHEICQSSKRPRCRLQITATTSRDQGTSSSSSTSTSQQVALHLPPLTVGTTLRMDLEIRAEHDIEQVCLPSEGAESGASRPTTTSTTDHKPLENPRDENTTARELDDSVNMMQNYQVGGASLSGGSASRPGTSPIPVAELLRMLRPPVCLQFIEVLRGRLRAWQALMDMLVVDEIGAETQSSANRVGPSAVTAEEARWLNGLLDLVGAPQPPPGIAEQLLDTDDTQVMQATIADSLQVPRPTPPTISPHTGGVSADSFRILAERLGNGDIMELADDMMDEAIAEVRALIENRLQAAHVDCQYPALRRTLIGLVQHLREIDLLDSACCSR